MKPERFQEIERLYHATLEREPGERAAYLEAACVGDKELHREVQSLLSFEEPSKNFIERLAAKEAARLFDTSSDPPARVGDFEIIRELGRGGMGIVYRAKQSSLGRVVALKVLPAQRFSDEKQIERFRREARAAARLHHPHIVPVHEVGEDRGVHYFAMQLIEGSNLGEVVQELRGKAGSDGHSLVVIERSSEWARSAVSAFLSGGPAGIEAGSPERELEPREKDGKGVLDGFAAGIAVPGSPHARFRAVARIGAQVADALAYAHGEGILHRDIKPSNLLMDARGTVWIADFGVAKSNDAESVTGTGDLCGTIAYMAPERFEGWSDPRSDIYSLGLTLYELLTLRPAFEDSDSRRLMKRVAEEIPLRPRKLDPRIPRDLETVIQKCIAKEPSQRYARADSMATDLRLYLEGKPILARRTTRTERSWRWCRRNPALAGLAASLGALVLVTAGIMVMDDLRVRDKLRDSYLAQAQANRWSGRMGRRFESLEAIRKAAAIRPGEDLRNEAMACLALPDVRISREWKLAGGKSFAVGFDSRLERYAIDPGDGSVSVRRMEDDREIVHFGDIDPEHYYFNFSVDGRYLWSGMGRRMIRIWDLESRKQILNARGYTKPAFSPDGRSVLLEPNEGRNPLLELPSCQVSMWLPARVENASFHPEGRVVAGVNPRKDRILSILDSETGVGLSELEHPKTIETHCWSRDGRRLAVVSHLTIHIWDVATEKVEYLLGDVRDTVSSIQFSHDDGFLVSSTAKGSTTIWDLISRKAILECPGRAHPCAIDGSGLPYEARFHSMGIWELARAEECVVIRPPPRGHPVGPGGLAFSPDGEILALSCEEGISLSSRRFAREVAFLPVGPTCSVWFQKGGEALVASGEYGLVEIPLLTTRQGADLQVQTGSPVLLNRVSANAWEAAPRGDGRQVAMAHYWGHEVLLLDVATGSVRAMGKHGWAAHVAVSPDDSWVASGTWRGAGVRIWAGRDGVHGADLPIPDSASVAFSPDGRFLVTSTGTEYGFWRTGSWERVHTIPRQGVTDAPGAMAFSTEGSLLAVVDPPTVVQLVDVRRLQVIGRLDSSRFHEVSNLCFSQDGTLLAAAAAEQDPQAIEIWDLRRMRAQLAALGLDWDLPLSIPTAGSAEPAIERITIASPGSSRTYPDTSPTLPLSVWKARCLAKARGKDKENLHHSYNLALCNELNGDLKQAVMTLEDFLERTPTDILDEKLAEYRFRALPDLLSYASIEAALTGKETLITWGAEWRYFQGARDPSPPFYWTRLEYDDGGWDSGKSGFGFGDPMCRTLLHDLVKKYITLYLRREFSLAVKARFEDVILRVKMNGGFVAYLNGVEVARAEAGEPGTPVAYNAWASSNKSAYHEIKVDAANLLPGRNLLAIHVLGSSQEEDIFFVEAVLLAKRKPDPELDRSRFADFFSAAREPGATARRAYLEGRLLQRENRQVEAIEKFRESVAADPDGYEPLLALCDGLRAGGQTADEARLRVLLEEKAAARRR